jgi:hypothetical protein
MHFHFPFTVVEVLWTLTFAAQLVLLVVLLGRERVRRFPWFTASIVILALRALAARVLFHRLPELTFSIIFITLADVGLVLGLMVLVEMARIGFRGVRRVAWIATTVVGLAIAGVVLAYWGAWPAWKQLTANSRLAVLVLMQLGAQKGQLLLGVLTVELGILVVIFGRSYHAGWRTHVQRIVVGLSTAAMAELAVSGIWEIIVKHFVPKSREQYERVLDLRDKISNANSAVYLVVLVWLIACLWMDEPGAARPEEALPPVKKTFIEAPAGSVEVTEASQENESS